MVFQASSSEEFKEKTKAGTVIVDFSGKFPAVFAKIDRFMFDLLIDQFMSDLSATWCGPCKVR